MFCFAIYSVISCATNYRRVVEPMTVRYLMLLSGRLWIPPCGTRICDVNILDSWRTLHASSQCITSCRSWGICHQLQQWGINITNSSKMILNEKHRNTNFSLFFPFLPQKNDLLILHFLLNFCVSVIWFQTVIG